MLSRFGPALVPLLCVPPLVGVAAVGAFVPIGHQGQTLEGGMALGIVLCAAALAAWSLAVGLAAWGLTRVESTSTILVPSMSPGVFDLVFSLPFLGVVPAAALAVVPLLRGGLPAAPGVLALPVWLGLMALREADETTYVRDARVHVRKGWLLVRREAAPVGQVRGVRVDRDSYRGAPSYVVKLEVDPARYPRLARAERRYRSTPEADAEAARWRRAIGPPQGPPPGRLG